jgi:four helix bundle protein
MAWCFAGAHVGNGGSLKIEKDYLRFLNIALGSLCEVETQLLLSSRLGFRGADDLGPSMALVRELDRVLCALIRAVRASACKEA